MAPLEKASSNDVLYYENSGLHIFLKFWTTNTTHLTFRMNNDILFSSFKHL